MAWLRHPSGCGCLWLQAWASLPLFVGMAALPRFRTDVRSTGNHFHTCSLPCKVNSCCANTGPASHFSTVYATDTPVTVSPFSRHLFTGAAPRYLGSSEGWMFRVPKLGMSSNCCGSMFPYAAVTHRSGSKAAKADKNLSCTAHNTLHCTLCRDTFCCIKLG